MSHRSASTPLSNRASTPLSNRVSTASKDPVSTDSFSAEDVLYMSEALRLARKGLYTTNPNPRVGCVIVRDGRIVGRGFHYRAGEGHAEVHALADAGEAAKGAIAYVTLEPCSHFGRTPPCAQALIEAGVSEVVGAMKDPNPVVAGQGFALLEGAGITVRVGCLEANARQLNPGFIKRMETGLPWVRIKVAISVDGRTAMSSGESQWITGAAARSDVQRLRARSSAIVTGIGTIQHDDAALTVRAAQLGLPESLAEDVVSHQPMRVIMDRQATLETGKKVLENSASVLWCVAQSAKVSESISNLAHVEVLELNRQQTDVQQFQKVLKVLAEKSCNEVLVEAGAGLVGTAIASGLWDELVVYMAPKLMGSTARPMAEMPISDMASASELVLTDMRMIGDDIRMTYRPADRLSSDSGN